MARQLRVIEELNVQIRESEKKIARMAEANEVCRRLMTVPGVGPATATRFLAALDDISRFPGAEEVGSYLGLTPVYCEKAVRAEIVELFNLVWESPCPCFVSSAAF